LWGEQRGIIMSAMSDSSVLTRDDLDALPDNGLRRELVDGAIVMTPAPGTAASSATSRGRWHPVLLAARPQRALGHGP